MATARDEVESDLLVCPALPVLLLLLLLVLLLAGCGQWMARHEAVQATVPVTTYHG